jgi:hypothetical protein
LVGIAILDTDRFSRAQKWILLSTEKMKQKKSLSIEDENRLRLTRRERFNQETSSTNQFRGQLKIEGIVTQHGISRRIVVAVRRPGRAIVSGAKMRRR